MTKTKHKTYQKEAKDGETEKLKKKIRRLESDKRKLKSELATLEAAFLKTTRYLKDSTDGISVEKIIADTKKDKTLEVIKVDLWCSKCGNKSPRLFELPESTMILCDTCGNREFKRKGKK